MEETEKLDSILTAALKKEIESHVKELKEKDGKLKMVYPIIVEGEEYDDKEYYLAYFRQPNFTIFSKYLTFSQKDQAVAMRALATDCFIDGDKNLVDDDSLFLFGLFPQLGKLIQMRNGRLVNLSKAGK